MARIVEIEGDNPPDPNFLPNPPRFNVELPHTSCFTEDKNGSLTRKFFTTPDELANHLKRAIPRHKERKLYVLEGLPIEYVQVLGLHFNIDVDIFDSHAMRKSGQLNKLKFSTRPGNEKKVRTFALDHPEIAANITPLPEANEGVVGDFMLPCQTIGISNEGWNGISVKLCHVTLVCFPGEDGGETLLLLLENQSWSRRGAQFQTAGYHSILANALKSLPEGTQKWKPSRKHDPALTLADEIFNSIESPGGILVWNDLTEILADIVLRQWKFALGEVIEHAYASRLIPYHEIHQVCDLIESNIWILDRTEAFWSPRYDVRMEGFKRLLEQAKRYAEVFVWGQIVEEGLETKTKTESGSDNEDDDDTTSTTSSKSGVHIRRGEALDLETRQSINRVTYLGDPAEIPLPPLDSDLDDWRERDSSEGIRPELSPSPGHADSDYATDRERRSLERRMRENDDWELTRRRSREHPGSGDGYERNVEREIILHRRRRSEHSVTSEERKHVIERKTEKVVEEQEGNRATDDIVKNDDDVPEDRGRQRRRSKTRRAHHETYYDYPRRPTPNTDPTEIPLPPSPEEQSEEERIRTRLEREKLEYLEKLKQKERHTRMAELEKEHARKRAEEEHAKRRAEEEYARKRVEEEYKEKAAESKAVMGKDRAYSPVASDDKGVNPAIKFKDAGMEELVKQAFRHVDVIGPHVNDGHYDLLGPTGEIILPQVWESVIEPGWLITMHMWPMPEPRRQAPAPMPSRPGHPGNFPPAGFTETQPGGLMSGPTPRIKKFTQTGTIDWMAGARHSKSRKKQKSVPIRLGPPPPLSFPRPPPPPPASGRRESDTVVIIEELPPKVHRRQTGMSDRHRHGTSGGGIIGGAAKPNEELGWVRALGTIVGVKPGIQVKKRSGGSSSSSSV
ncbi:hypothetical protein BCON_0183g00070 [Botryotinia convoluta]|uniref:Ubiquitin-like domain-containing protein n=1 Tax=Botryotinia convoluta TaxID=54673 RepID=A0A4Z1HNJ6_9HELO|nr:hypothetical protein BCON_0183g00070 [Botryotinia convoluta]